eukprot:scaffold13997_cov72-Phaeocystis_antarctica.AAC.4
MAPDDCPPSEREPLESPEEPIPDESPGLVAASPPLPLRLGLGCTPEPSSICLESWAGSRPPMALAEAGAPPSG